MSQNTSAKSTAIGQVRGLGASHHGSHHWLMQRFTAAGNLVTVGFLALSILLLPDLSYLTVRSWLAQPLPATMLALLIVSVFWHARLGLTVLIEDYLHSSASKMAALIVLNLTAVAGAVFGLVCLASIVIAGLSSDAVRSTVAEAAAAQAQQQQQGAGR